jgi:hypothetical protein
VIYLVDRGGGIERVARGFGGNLGGRELPQFVIDEREQFRRGLSVSPFNGFDQAGHITHEGKAYTPPYRPSLEDEKRHVKISLVRGLRQPDEEAFLRD